MAKILLFFFLITISSTFSINDESYDEIFSTDDYVEDNTENYGSRIAAGIDSNRLENLDYARLSIEFETIQKVCGGSLFRGLYV